ncbi:outer membrane protein OmpK [Pontibacter liquoris]|uniref:outer membrane protein OmpK n=1 Tax=Pontibacter liquoris TaxID=2905677 RepID=UPI001FA766D0|nr:outer membrane protein OmpK [Pontibacter liquoris]
MHLSADKPGLSSLKKLFVLLFACVALLAHSQAQAQVVYNGGSNVQFLYGRNLKQTGDLATITLEHFGGYGAFEHFGFMDLSNDVSLKSPDMYLEWYPKVSLSRATGKQIGFGPISDVLLAGGINVLFGGPEDFFVYTAGPAFKFSIPGSGLLQLETYYYKETKAVLHGTYQITPSWDIPLPVSEKVSLRFRGFMDFIGDRGPGSTQYLTQPQLFLDLGNLKGKPGKVYLGSEWRYWHNVAGIPDLEESVLQANLMFNL